jgi:hypothetical protein
MLEIVHSVPFVFYGETFKAHLASDRQWYIPVNDVCDALGIDPRSQRRRIQDDAAISDRLVNVPMETPYQDATRVQDVSCLNLRALPYWLGTIDAKRVKHQHQKKVILFKREFAEAAWFVFRSDIMPEEVLAEMDSYATPQEQEYAEIMDQARDLRKKIDLLSGKVDEEIERVGAEISDLDGRLGALETKLVGRTIINSAQAKQISDMIGLVALSMHEKNKKKTKSLCFAEVHNDFKAQFDVHIYSVLPEDKIEDAINYLAGRWARLNPGEPVPDIFRGGYQPSLF